MQQQRVTRVFHTISVLLYGFYKQAARRNSTTGDASMKRTLAIVVVCVLLFASVGTTAAPADAGV
jgi:hypothetical protein